MIKLLKLLRLITLTLFCAFSVASMHGSAPAPTTLKTYKDTPASLAERVRVTEILNAHVNGINLKKPVEFSWLPGYYLKDSENRLIGARAILDCITKNNLKLIVVPENGPMKYLRGLLSTKINLPFQK